MVLGGEGEKFRRGWESVHLWAHIKLGYMRYSMLQGTFGYCSKFRAFLQLFHAFSSSGKWARRKKKLRMAKQRRSQSCSLCCCWGVVGAVLFAKSRSRRSAIWTRFDSGCKGQSKGEGQRFCRRWEISSLTANRSRDVGIMSSLVAPLNFTGAAKKMGCKTLCSSVIRDCYSPPWESWNFAYEHTQKAEAAKDSFIGHWGYDPKPDRRGEDSGAVWHPSSHSLLLGTLFSWMCWGTIMWSIYDTAWLDSG